jgi:hypothetical protein
MKTPKRTVRPSNRRKGRPYKTLREYVLVNQAEEFGMIEAWEHIAILALNCVKAHKETAGVKYLRRQGKANAHLIEELKLAEDAGNK